jgi:hypothetical protein
MHSLLHAATGCVNALSHTVRVKFSHPFQSCIAPLAALPPVGDAY